MSTLISSEEIKSSIIEETAQLNSCLTEWYHNVFPDDLDEFKGCCNEDEINLLITCYMIYSEHNSELLESLDKHFIKALVAYYYMIVVFENYIYNYIDEKYLRIVKEEDSQVPNNKIFTDNDDNIYAYYWTKWDKDEKYIEVKDPFKRTSYYVSNTDRIADPYFYKDKRGKIKIKLREHMDCLENILNTRKSKEYYKIFFESQEDWISRIRRIILNMNIEPFEGFRGGKSKTLKNNKKIKNNKKNKRITKKSKSKSKK